MAVDTDFAISAVDGIASVAPYGTAAPVGMAALSAPWVDLGALDTSGMTETITETRTSYKRWGSINTFKTTITDQAKTFDLSPLESNPHVLDLFYKAGGVPVPTGAGTNEVQTVTVSGAPTGGTFVLVFGDEATTDLPYNAAASAVQSALQALPSVGAGNVTVAGAAGGPFTVTFAGALADQNVAQLNATADLTGGTSPAVTVATTTQGAAGQLLTLNDNTTGAPDIRAFVFDLIEGMNHIRFYLPRAEVTARKNPTYNNSTIVQYGMTVTAYPDPATVDGSGNPIAVQRTYLLDAIAG